ncbi:MAG: methyltransferase domain-containing protein [Actinomycetota bacterium]|jgi:ubiquinone/menaquinone biosynthesis C-methylase UbiE|nr:methyltransferase domain-containing protein [Actinomycetota bacterium]MCL6092811.1 methyltransferase domain-containing protein [Actinomycetota bacterium]MDA8166213.1 methyltransferase domain-containing protein [Actinomycetota bacterium]
MAVDSTRNLIKDTFDTVCKGYDGEALAFFPRSAAAMTRRLGLRGDEHVLDVATGTGHLALSIASALTRGRVTAIDFSQGMLNCARQKAIHRGTKNVEFIEMDMQNMELKARSFDVAVCSFGIFFVEDMSAQLKKITSLVKPGGTVAISTFEENHYFPPLVELMINRLEKFGVDKPPQTWKNVAREDGCRKLLESSALTNIHIGYENVGYHLATPEEWWCVIWNGGFRRLVDRLGPEQMARFRSEHLAEVDSRRNADGIWLDVGVLFSIGQRPAV